MNLIKFPIFLLIKLLYSYFIDYKIWRIAIIYYIGFHIIAILVI